jgi:hypothetical protein
MLAKALTMVRKHCNKAVIQESPLLDHLEEPSHLMVCVSNFSVVKSLPKAFLKWRRWGEGGMGIIEVNPEKNWTLTVLALKPTDRQVNHLPRRPIRMTPRWTFLLGFRDAVIIRLEALMQAYALLENHRPDKGRGRPSLFPKNSSESFVRGAQRKSSNVSYMVNGRVHSSEHAGVRRRGQRNLTNRIFEHYSTLGQLIQMRCLRRRISVTSHPVSPQGVDGDQYDVERFPSCRLLLFPSGRSTATHHCGQNHKKQEATCWEASNSGEHIRGLLQGEELEGKTEAQVSRPGQPEPRSDGIGNGSCKVLVLTAFGLDEHLDLSEVKPQRKLDDARRVGLTGYVLQPGRVIRIIIIRMIEEVKEVCRKPKVHTFAEPEVLVQRQINVPSARSDDKASGAGIVHIGDIRQTSCAVSQQLGQTVVECGAQRPNQSLGSIYWDQRHGIYTVDVRGGPQVDVPSEP